MITRHDWSLEEIQALLALPLMDLLWQAQQVHRAEERRIDLGRRGLGHDDQVIGPDRVRRRARFVERSGFLAAIDDLSRGDRGEKSGTQCREDRSCRP